MILPQLRQFGAGAKSGWMAAKQEHFRDSLLRVGFVDTSSAAIAAVRSDMLVVVKEFLDWLVVVLLLCRVEEDFAALDLTFGNKSESIGPDAEGGGLLELCFGAGE